MELVKLINVQILMTANFTVYVEDKYFSPGGKAEKITQKSKP